MEISKRGIFFTLISLLFVSILVIMFASSSTVISKYKIQSISLRVELADSFIRNLESHYIPTLLIDTSSNAIVSITDYLYRQNNTKYFSSYEEFNNAVQEIMINGTLYKEDLQSYGISTMKGKTLKSRINLIKEFASKSYQLNLNIDTDKIKINIFQSEKTGPWYYGVNCSINYTLTTNVASWNRSKTITVFVPIEKLNDPLFIIEPDSHYLREVKKAPFDEWDITSLNTHINQGTYRYEKRAPNYIMRFYGNFSSSPCCGIESTINKTLSNQEYNKIYIDYCFWSNECDSYGPLYNITGITNDNFPFMLDEYHVNRYNVSEEAVK